MASSSPQYGIGQYGVGQYGLGILPGTIGVPFIGHTLHINSVVKATGNLESRVVFNQFDEHGLLLGTERLPGEKNWEYKRRLLDVFSNRANSTYRGLINGITRELGLSLYSPLLVNPRTNVDGSFLASDPYIKFDGAYLYLYSDYTQGILDYQIDRYQVGGNFEHLQRLINLINTTSFFEAALVDGTDPFTRSMTIINQSNRITSKEDLVPSSNRFRLEHNHIVPGTLFLSTNDVYFNRVENVTDISEYGDWHIDYLTGIFTGYSIPGTFIGIRYQYTDYPFKPLASDIILHDINDDNFKTKMFEQILLDDGTYTHGIPTEIGVDIINELLSVTPMYWGV